MRFAASGQLIDGDAAVFLPDSGGCDRGLVGRVSIQRIPKLQSATDKAIEVGKVSLDLSLQSLVHQLRFGLFLRRGRLCGI